MGKRLINRVTSGFRKFLKGDCGFTLVETLGAMTIFGLVSVVFLMGLSVSSKTLMVSQQSVTAENIAKSQMEDTRIQPYTLEATTYPSISLPQELTGEGYSVSVSAASLNTPDDGIQEVTVTVTRNSQAVFTIVDYKLDAE